MKIGLEFTKKVHLKNFGKNGPFVLGPQCKSKYFFHFFYAANDFEEDNVNFTFTNIHVVQFESGKTLAIEGPNPVYTLLLYQDIFN